jgi:gliding motility-associated-like protein
VITYPTGVCPIINSDIAQVTVNDYPVIISTYRADISTGETFTVSPNTLNGDIVPPGTTYTWTIHDINPANSITGAFSNSTPQSSISQTLIKTTPGIATVTYTVTPTSGVCSGADFTVIVTVHPPVDPNIILTNISCNGANDGSIQTAIVGGVPFKNGNPYLIDWKGPNGFTSTSASIFNLKKGIYILTIKDSVGFTFIKSDTIIEPQLLILIPDIPKNVSCFGSADGEIAVRVTGGTPPYRYNWEKDALPFTGTGTGTKEIKNLGPGIYKVTVTDSLNCGPKVFSDTITEKPGMIIKLIKQSNLKCYGDSTGTISVNVSGGQAFKKSSGVLYYDYSWSGPNGYTSTNQNLTHLAGGIYILTVTDSIGCHQTINDTITQPAEIVINAITTPITCSGENNASIKLDIAGGIPPYQILWSNLGNGLVQNNLSPGKYTVTVTDFVGCQKTKEIIITEPDFSIHPVVTQITCFGVNDGSINLNVHSGISPVTLVWTDDPTAGEVRNRLGPATYTVLLSDTSGCQITKSFTILPVSEITIAAAITDAFDCNNPSSGAIKLTVSGGTLPYTYVWSNGATTKDLSAIQAGTFDVTVTDSLGCNLSKSFVVLRPDPIVLSVDTVPDFNCQTKVLTEICTAKIKGGIPPYQCTWSSGTQDALNNQIMRTTQSGMIVLTVVDGHGCTADYTFSVSIPEAGINSQLINCDNHVVAFTATIPTGVAGDYTFLWNFGDGKTETIQNPQHTFTTSGTFKVSLTMTNASCTDVYEKNIVVDPTPVLVLDKLPIFCIGDSLLLHVTGADTYHWSNGSTTDSTFIKQTGDYFVTGTSKAGCTGTLTFTATNFNPYNYTIQTDREEVTTVNPTLQLWSQSITFSDYFWDFGDGATAEGNNQSHTYNILKDGYYDVKLKVRNPNGCLEFATKRIWITNTTTGNVFTPNGDGVDDIFMKGWHIQVYNRNGILIYEGTEGWDGTFKGKAVSNDTYFYVLYVTGASGVKTRTGFVTVVR